MISNNLYIRYRYLCFWMAIDLELDNKDVVQAKDALQTKVLLKSVFLSYYISMYKTINEAIGFSNQHITVNEIYDFIQDLKYEMGVSTISVDKKDISLCFNLLQTMGLCKTPEYINHCQ
jgi:hypothetical protein